MAATIQTNFRMRHSFGKIEHILEIPNLIDIQKRSYDKFLQTDVPRDDRQNTGLQGVFNSVFPIRDFNGTSELVFSGYTLERPKYDVDECRQRGMTYAAPIKVTIQLIIYDTSGDSSERAVRDIKEQEVYFGEIPLMTVNGTFIINGTERVVVSQLHRSPGVFFDHDRGKTHSSGKLLYQARIIPYRGSWLDLEFDPKDLLYVRIDRRRKMPATVLLKALGYNTQELLNYYYDTETVYILSKDQYAKSIEYELLTGQRATHDIAVGEDVIVRKNRKFTRAAIRKLKSAGLDYLPIDLSLRKTSSMRTPARFCSRSTKRSPRVVSMRSVRRASTSSRFSSSTASTSGLTSATRCSSTRCSHKTRVFSRFTAGCVRVTRPRSTPRGTSSTTCSSTRSATTSARSDASS